MSWPLLCDRELSKELHTHQRNPRQTTHQQGPRIETNNKERNVREWQGIEFLLKRAAKPLATNLEAKEPDGLSLGECISVGLPW